MQVISHHGRFLRKVLKGCLLSRKLMLLQSLVQMKKQAGTLTKLTTALHIQPDDMAEGSSELDSLPKGDCDWGMHCHISCLSTLLHDPIQARPSYCMTACRACASCCRCACRLVHLTAIPLHNCMQACPCCGSISRAPAACEHAAGWLYCGILCSSKAWQSGGADTLSAQGKPNRAVLPCPALCLGRPALIHDKKNET